MVSTDLFALWKSQPWTPNIEQAQILNGMIGAQDYDKRNVYVPCAIRTPNRAIAHRAIVIAATGDRFGSWPLERDVAIRDGNHELSPSAFALRADVRTVAMVTIVGMFFGALVIIGIEKCQWPLRD